MKNNELSYRISSNLTLGLKIGLPVFWFIFFGAMTIGLVLSNPEQIPIVGLPRFKQIIVAFFVLFFILIYFTLLRLKRVEVSDTHFYVSNYFKTFRYPFEEVEKIKSLDFGIILILTIQLKNKGKMGKKLPFIASKSRLSSYLSTHETAFLTSELASRKDK